MQTPAALLGQVYDRIFDIKSKTEAVEKLKERLEHLDDENVEDTFNETKIIINSLCESVSNIEKIFTSGYEAWVARKNNVNSECSNGDPATMTGTAQEKSNSPKDSPLSINETEHNNTDSDSTNAEKAQTNGMDINEDDSISSVNSAASKDVFENIGNHVNNDDTESTKKLKPFGLIKVIDINKLIDPNKVITDENRNSEKIKDSDSDVVIISDSEDKPKTKTKADSKKKNKRKRTNSDDSDINKEAFASRSRRKQKLEVLKDTFATFREKRSTIKKITIKESSDNNTTDSDSSDLIDLSDTRPKHKAKTKSISPQKTKELCDAQSDKKYSWKAYVPLLRIPCEKLKEHYLNILEDAEIDKLTNLDTLDKTFKQSTSNNGSNKVKTKKTKLGTSKGSNKGDESKESNSDSDIDNVGDISDKSDKVSTHENSEKSGGEDVNLDDICASPVSSNGEETDSVNKKEKTSKKKSEKKAENETPDKSDGEKDSNASGTTDKGKKKWRKDPLLTSKLSDSDSDEQFTKYRKKLDNPNRLKYRKIIGSDSEGEDGKARSGSNSDVSKSKDQSSDSEKETTENKKKTKRRRIREVETSSDEGNKTTRKQIRKVIANSSLAETTKLAQKEEAERKARIAERQKKYNNICDADYPTDAKVEEVILDFDEETNEKLLAVHPDIVKSLKPHQAAGVQFMWNACFESLKRASESKGSGCILAHCMGLGKTLQVIALSHTLLTNGDKTGIRKVLVVCPLNTVLNWVAEFKQWLPKDDEIELFELNSFKANYERKYQAEEWNRCGGVFIISYDMFRNLTNADNKRIPKKMRTVFKEALVDPGPDLVVCDEGHLLKNEKTSISIAMNLLKTSRRIVLTGTPLQNNLKEYWCMVQFVKPNLLGTYKEYLNRFVNPITNGQYTDSTPHDIHIMRKRSHVLHKLLDGIVQRRDYSVLAPYLPPKHEYVLFLSLTEIQVKLYRHYLNEYARKPCDGEKLGKTSFLFADFQEFQRICTHPRVLLDKSIEVKIARDRQDLFCDEDSEGSLKDFINDDDEKSTTSSSSSSSEDNKSEDEGGSDASGKNSKHKVQMGRLTRSNAALAGGIEQIEEQNKEEEPPEWWQQYIDNEELDVLNHGTKLFLLFEILKQCEAIGDKVLVFSQSLYSLNIIEYFLNKIDEATQNDGSLNGFTGSWAKGLDYYRLDGSSSCENRSAWCKSFNNETNTRARLFLISTRAGGLGINLVAANRVVIFDASWNPSHDIQSIYRVYRFGQKKPCYIYRFVMYGTMEMKIYERQVTKQAISKRVIDEQQIDRHYNQNDLAELYKFDQIPEERPTPLVPKDVLLAELLQNLPQQIYRYHEHQSLLENKEDEVLNEEERKAAWEEYETEKTVRQQQQPVYINDNISMLIQNLPVPAIVAAFTSMLKKSKPDITPVHLNNAMSSLFTQLRLQLASGMTALYDKIITELMMLNVKENQKYKEVLEYMIFSRPQPGIPQFPYVQQTPNLYPNANKPMTSSNEVIELLD